MASRVIVYTPLVIAEAIRGSTEIRAAIAAAAASDARSTAPVETGQYKDGAGSEVAGDTVLIVNNDPEAGYKEFGTSDTPAHMTMVNAARKYGRYFGGGRR
jgi:hypothetical protein